MSQDLPKQSTALIVQKFELESTDEKLSEEELFDLLADQIAYMIEYRMEFLLSLMYRLDVDEAKINFALSPFCQDPANVALAKLVLERQKQRMHTKRTFKPEDFQDGEDWEW